MRENNAAESVNLIERARAGDRAALDTRRHARFNVSDVVQEASVEVAGGQESI